MSKLTYKKIESGKYSVNLDGVKIGNIEKESLVDWHLTLDGELHWEYGFDHYQKSLKAHKLFLNIHFDVN